MIRDLSLDYPAFLIASSEWFAFVPAKEYFDEPGDHADELDVYKRQGLHKQIWVFYPIHLFYGDILIMID